MHQAFNTRGPHNMPTTLPDPRKRNAQASEELLVHIMIVVMVVGMVIACAIVARSFLHPDAGAPPGASGNYTPATVPPASRRKVGDKFTSE
jgi:hypothetical protein